MFVLSCSFAPVYSQTAGEGSLTVVIEPVFNGMPLKLADQYYLNEHGDTLYIDLFRFYITNLKCNGGSKSTVDVNSHLVDAEDKETTAFRVDHLPEGTYSSLEFTVGVDSTANTNGANSGDLDPAKGMYWAWNSGYIMAKLEGRSKKCATFHHVFEFHVGGYMPPYNAARNVTLQLPHAVTVKSGVKNLIRIKADAAAWFSGLVDLSKFNDVVIPGKEACMMADKYMHMFSAGDMSME